MPWAYVIGDIKGEKIVGTFYKKELQKANQKELKVEENKDKEKANKLYVKWKSYDNTFDSWINKKDIVNIFQNRNLQEEE